MTSDPLAEELREIGAAKREGRDARPIGEHVDVEALPRRVAHAVHALVARSKDTGMPVTAAEVCEYDDESFGARGTARALVTAQRKHGLAIYADGYWTPSSRALEQRTDFETRYLRETEQEGDVP